MDNIADALLKRIEGSFEMLDKHQAKMQDFYSLPFEDKIEMFLAEYIMNSSLSTGISQYHVTTMIINFITRADMVPADNQDIYI